MFITKHKIAVIAGSIAAMNDIAPGHPNTSKDARKGIQPHLAASTLDQTSTATVTGHAREARMIS